MPVLMTSEAQGLSEPVYTQVLGALKASLQNAPGLILHSAHEVEGGFRVVELWQSKPESDRFFAEHVAPNLPPGVRPKRRTVELLSWVTPGRAGRDRAMSFQALREASSQLQFAATALAALGAALHARANGAPLDHRIGPYVDDVLAAVGLAGSLEKLQPGEFSPLLTEIRTFMFQNTGLLGLKVDEPGWSHANVEMLQAAGDASAGFALTVKNRIAPQLNGLLDRLESADGKFLDIGVGVAALSTQMARVWPQLCIVGIDPWEPALALAREKVRVNQLAERIELRNQRAEDLADSNKFDLAWLPGAFVPKAVIAMAVTRVHEALRPGGWLLFAMMTPGADPLSAAVARLRTALFGGCQMSAAELEALLQTTGFEEIRRLPSLPLAPVSMVAARRASSVRKR